LKLFLIAGEASGDALGAELMAALRRRSGACVECLGVGGPAMARQGLVSLFPLGDLAVMGFGPVIRRLPSLLRRMGETAEAVAAARPDALVLIDSPDFTHRVAKRARRALPDLPIVDYVSPTVWAWRPGRARAMRAYVDRVLALLPFEPEAHARLGGPPCVYVGHPLIERLADLRPAQGEREPVGLAPPLVLMLPGSRRLEIERLLPTFGAAAEEVEKRIGPIDWVLPAVDHLESLIRDKIARWRRPPRVVVGEQAKWAAFRAARAGLAASGTVTLELALAAVPMVVGYRVSKPESLLRFLVTAPSIVLPNLILGAAAIPELLQDECEPGRLADALVPLIKGGPERDAQITSLARLDALMSLPDGLAPSEAAAREVLAAAEFALKT
jgi:lipid-A-disaccharide synthase